MYRRSLLTALGGAGVGAVAGCLTDGGQPGDDGGPSGSNDTPDDRTDAPPPTDATWTAEETPGAADGPTPSPDAAFPPDRDDVDGVVWRDEVSDPEGRLFLDRSEDSAELPAAALSFTLRNGTDRTFQTNFYDWAIYRWEGGRWHHVTPRMVPQPLMTLEPGAEPTWELTVDGGDLGEPIVSDGGSADVSVGPLGGGRYAFAVDGWWADQDATPAYEHQTVCAARFELVGDDLPLVPSDAVSAARRDGDTTAVTAENPRGGGESAAATYVLTRDDDAGDPETLLTEQVYRRWPLRDALAHADPDSAEIRVETTTASTPPFGVQDDEPPIRYEGRTYRVSAETNESE